MTATAAIPLFLAPGAEAPEPGTPPRSDVPAGEVCAEKVEITPDMAGEWMDRHRKAVAANRAQNGGKARDNRPVRWGDDGVGGYARDMKAGKWRLNGETIKIARDGTVPDGQHRLLAGIEAGVPFWSLVVTGVEPEAQDTIDIGIGRKLADSLSIAGKPNHIALASIARWSLRWLHGHRGGTTGGGTYKPTQREVLEYIAQAPHLELAAKFAVHARKEFRPVRASTWGMAWLLLNGTDALAATVFFERVFDGADLPRKSPVLVFRTRLTNAALNKERLTETEQLALMITAWNYWRDDREMGALKLPEGGLTAKNFPEPK